jgi:hypothetical protein
MSHLDARHTLKAGNSWTKHADLDSALLCHEVYIKPPRIERMERIGARRDGEEDQNVTQGLVLVYND